MKRLFLITALAVVVFCCAACSENQTLKEPEENTTPPEPETVIVTEYITLEPETVIEYVTLEPETVIVTEYLAPEDPVGYLKDRVTEEGILGEDYPIVSYYGPRSSEQGLISANHKGIDFAMEEGTILLAPFDSLVSYAGYNEERGYWVVMYWGNGYYLEYQHLSEILVLPGQILTKGDPVARSGNTGTSLIPHLHMEILQCDSGKDEISDFNDNRTRINPYYFIFGNDEVVDSNSAIN